MRSCLANRIISWLKIAARFWLRCFGRHCAEVIVRIIPIIAVCFSPVDLISINVINKDKCCLLLSFKIKHWPWNRTHYLSILATLFPPLPRKSTVEEHSRWLRIAAVRWLGLGYHHIHLFVPIKIKVERVTYVPQSLIDFSQLRVWINRTVDVELIKDLGDNWTDSDGLISEKSIFLGIKTISKG